MGKYRGKYVVNACIQTSKNGNKQYIYKVFNKLFFVKRFIVGLQKDCYKNNWIYNGYQFFEWDKETKCYCECRLYATTWDDLYNDLTF